MLKTGVIYKGDCLSVLKQIPDESVDLIYLDPPFFSNRDYETSFKTGGEIRGFGDKWEGGISHYVSWMVERLKEMHRILKKTGSLYLHCDWHAIHYLKVELDKIFGMKNFRNEIIWHYRTGGVSKNWFSRKHDNILFYSKSNKWTFNPEEIKEYYDKKPGLEDRKSGKDEKGYFHWVYRPDVWIIPGVFNMSNEFLGYPTQKPEDLLEIVIKCSSNEGDIILDPFSGSGTTLAVAQRLNRKWIALDSSVKACNLIKKRLEKLGTNVEIKEISSEFLDILDKAKEMDSYGYKEFLLKKLDVMPCENSSMIDAFTSTKIPISIKKQGADTFFIDDFKTLLKDKGFDKGVIISNHFSEGAYNSVGRMNKSNFKLFLIEFKSLAENDFDMNKFI